MQQTALEMNDVPSINPFDYSAFADHLTAVDRFFGDTRSVFQRIVKILPLRGGTVSASRSESKVGYVLRRLPIDRLGLPLASDGFLVRLPVAIGSTAEGLTGEAGGALS